MNKSERNLYRLLDRVHEATGTRADHTDDPSPEALTALRTDIERYRSATRSEISTATLARQIAAARSHVDQIYAGSDRLTGRWLTPVAAGLAAVAVLIAGLWQWRGPIVEGHSTAATQITLSRADGQLRLYLTLPARIRGGSS